MTPEAILPINIDSTMMTCFRSCPEKFRLEFVYGLRPEGISVDLHAGGCYATALEVAYRAIHEANQPLERALELAHAAFMVEWGDFEIPEYKKTGKTRDNVWFAVEEYFRRFPPLTDHIQPYFVDGKPTFEFTFAIPLEPCITFDPMATNMEDREKLMLEHFPTHPVTNEPWIYSGRFDMLGAYEKKPIVKDDKTTGRTMSTGWADQWNLRSQFMGYVWACQQLGLDVDSVVVRGCSILKTKIDFMESPPKVYSQHLLGVWHEQLRRDLWRMRRAWDEGYFDLNLGDVCTSYGNCIFMDVCQSPNKTSWMNQFKVRRWNPLHKNPIMEAA